MTKIQFLKYKRRFANMWVAKNKITGEVITAQKTLQELATDLVKEKTSFYI